MCISEAVGPGATNRFEDVKALQILVNLNQTRFPAIAPLSEDGRWGSSTQLAIEAFQRTALGNGSPDGRVDPHGATLAALRTGLPPDFSEAKLRGIMPRASDTDIARFYQPTLPAMLAYGMDTPLRQAHFLAQVGHESGSFRYTEELATGAAYEGRTDLGNTHSGDGTKFKGRGLIQLTGRANYVAYGLDKGQNFTDGANPSMIARDVTLAIDVACWFWKRHSLNAVADLDDVRAVTMKVNGGLNGLADRQDFLVRSKFFLV
ncbi:MAG: chitinase [Acidobacteriia bacterium]|nr:chitinase [Terriglobia bacterium]